MNQYSNLLHVHKRRSYIDEYTLKLMFGINKVKKFIWPSMSKQLRFKISI